MNRTDVKALTRGELTKAITAMGEKEFRAAQIYEWLHKKRVREFSDMTNLSKAFRETLSERFQIGGVRFLDKRVSADSQTEKYLFRLFDDKVIESVLMRYRHGVSVCISSQAGCRMGCRFCASAIGGLERNLTVSELLDQVYEIGRQSGERVSHVVVMGTGEPLDNYGNLIRFIRMLTDEDGLHLSQRNLTVSTCGLTGQIRRLAGEGLAITLAISLHAPDDQTRKKLMPAANRCTIAELMDVCAYYFEQTGRRVTFEYSMIRDVNDSPEQAAALASLLRGKGCHVNLIPVNPVKELGFSQSGPERIQKFKKLLEKNRINVTIRREMGTDINAACGQLRKSYMERKRDGKEGPL